jgi:cell division protein FtsX
MPEAFVLIATEAGSEAEVLRDLRHVEGVDVVRVKAATMDQLKEIVAGRIRKLNNVRATLTLFVEEK